MCYEAINLPLSIETVKLKKNCYPCSCKTLNMVSVAVCSNSRLVTYEYLRQVRWYL